MAMKKRFYSVNGQMMGYEEGGVKKDFLTDHLGSITAEIDQTQTRTYDTRYSAYGRNNWSTGTGCGFGWVGSYGYRETGLFHMSHYVRARHYSYVTGGWSTVDPLWPGESAYGYVGGSPTLWSDASGKGKSDKCAVWKCTVDDSSLRHQFVCVDGPNGGCSGGMASRLVGSSCLTDRTYKPSDTPCIENVGVTCVLVTTSCTGAARACEEIRKTPDSECNYWIGGTCWGYAEYIAKVARCGVCKDYTRYSDRWKKCVQTNCSCSRDENDFYGKYTTCLDPNGGVYNRFGWWY